ncbi:glutathione hydrolase 1 proenzyme [Hydra vulgaris]|uniref:Glutathione hydrolase 1 proenzyme n=1 Tax=Hydra vulgaris TaxID=6087 RepID=A0ABM4CQM2_HYDVU
MYERLNDENTNRREDSHHKKKPLTTKQWLLILLTFLTVLAAVSVAVTITLYCYKHPRHFPEIIKSALNAELYQHGAVAADAIRCSIIGRDILLKNGSAVDAAIAVSFCLGLFSMHSTGIGGGGLMLVYTRSEKTIDSYDYRETAPGKAREDMFVNEPDKSKSGGLSIAVPGEVKGLYEAYKKHHKLPWSELLQPTIELCENGFPMTLRMYEAAEAMKPLIEKDNGLKDLLLTVDGSIKEVGQNITNKQLANTLRMIAKNPEDFYTGPLAENIVKDIRDAGGIITLDDLANYKVIQRKALVNELGDLILYTTSAPTGGPIVAHILNILKGYGFTEEDLKDNEKAVLTYHRIIEAFKFGYAQKTKMGDPNFLEKDSLNQWLQNMTSLDVGTYYRLKITDYLTHNISYYGAELPPPTDRGTTHLSIYAANGDAVSLTSTINDWYGSGFRSLTTGILYNNEMDDFSTPGQNTRFGYPPTAANYIKPNKRPVSSMAPVIMTDRFGDVKLVIGGSGGPKIITAVVQGIMYKTWFNDDLGQAVIRPRIHHQLIPNIVGGESNRALPQVVSDGLSKIGHELRYVVKPEYSAIQAIYIEKPGEVYAKSDPRKYGHSSGY